MKNLLIYIHPEKRFNRENQAGIKVQIDNSLDLGWKREDILLATNFDYEYNGVKSVVASDENFCSFCPCNSKINTILELFERGFIGDDIYWYHDCDVFQCVPINPEEIFPNNKTDIAMTDYGRSPRWNGGCIFFKKSARDIFEGLKELAYKFTICDEMALMIQTNGHNQLEAPYDYRMEAYVPNHKHSAPLDAPIPPSVGLDRVNRLNITYNFLFLWRQERLSGLYDMATKPIKAVHFHPTHSYSHLRIPNIVKFYMGDNNINTSFLSDNLVKVFRQHGMI